MTSVRLRPRSWKRVLFKLGMFLLLGAAVNFAVTWIAVNVLPATQRGIESDVGLVLQEYNNRRPTRLPFLTLADVEDVHMVRRSYFRRDISWRCDLLTLGHERFGDQTESFIFGLWRVGWPALSFQAEFWDIAHGVKGERFELGVQVTSRFDKAQQNVSLMRFFYWPIWPGFAINTIFYAALLWLLIFAPRNIRRLIRVRKGQCPACAYPVGTSAVCTECGHKLNTMNAATEREP